MTMRMMITIMIIIYSKLMIFESCGPDPVADPTGKSGHDPHLVWLHFGHPFDEEIG